jgi:hypothetical protein
MKSAFVSCLLLALCAAPACSGGAKPNILVIVIDTLYSDCRSVRE